MIHTTFAKVREAGACVASYKKLALAVGGISKYGVDTPLPLDKVVEICGVKDATWALRCTTESSRTLQIEFACRCAEHVLHLYEQTYPGDNRPRKAIEAARNTISDNSGAARAAARAAGDAARAAAWAAGDAARVAVWAAESAAWAAAGDAARAAWAAGAAGGTWQTEMLLALLREAK